MAVWRHKINIKQYFADIDAGPDGDDQLLPTDIRNKVAFELSKVGGLYEFRNELLDTSQVETAGDFNEWLERLYDYCDENRIWLGL